MTTFLKSTFDEPRMVLAFPETNVTKTLASLYSNYSTVTSTSPAMLGADFSASIFRIGALRQRYDFGNSRRIENYLLEHPEVMDGLLSALSTVDSIFGREVPIVLTMFDDPEANDFSKLFAEIWTRLEPDEAFDKLVQFDGEWYQGQPSSLHECLNFDLRFSE